MRQGIKNFIETVLFGIILLVLVQTFLEDFAVLAGWSWDLRRILIFSGFFFDLFFTIEFLVRLYYALARREGKEYMLHRKGWVDLVASVPLLMFNSGPAVMALVGGTLGIAGMGGLLNVLKVIKVVRIARVLRLLRVLKVFKQIKFVDSPMAQRHISRIVSTVVTALIVPVMLLSLFFSLVNTGDLEDEFKERTEYMVEFLQSQEPAVVWDYCQTEKSFLVVRQAGEALYSRFSDQDYQRYFAPTDYTVMESGEFTFFLDNRPQEKQQAKDNLTTFLVVVFLISILLIFYSPHFAMTVTDPIMVMEKGMNETSYNLEVRVPPLYKDDDVYRLAQAYNDAYLPMKARNTVEAQEMMDLQVDDLDSLFDGVAQVENSGADDEADVPATDFGDSQAFPPSEDAPLPGAGDDDFPDENDSAEEDLSEESSDLPAEEESPSIDDDLSIDFDDEDEDDIDLPADEEFPSMDMDLDQDEDADTAASEELSFDDDFDLDEDLGDGDPSPGKKKPTAPEDDLDIDLDLDLDLDDE